MENHGKSSIYGWFSQISHSKFGFSSHGKAMLITRGQKLELQAAPASIFGPKDGISLKVPLSVRRQKPISVLVKTGESFSEFLDLVLSTYFRDATVVTPFLTWPLRPAAGGPRQATKNGPRSADQQWCGVLPSMDRPREGTSFLSSKVATKRQIPCILTCHSRYSLCPNCFYIWQNGTIGCNILFRFRRTHCSCPS